MGLSVGSSVADGVEDDRALRAQLNERERRLSEEGARLAQKCANSNPL